MSVHPDGHVAVAEDADARKQQPNQVHDVLPFHLTVVADVGLHFLELRHYIAVIGLVN